MFIGNRGSCCEIQGGRSLQRTTHFYHVRKLSICQVSLLPQHFRGRWFQNRLTFNGSQGSYCGIKSGRSLRRTTHFYHVRRLSICQVFLLPQHSRGRWFLNRIAVNGSRGTYCGIKSGRNLQRTTHFYHVRRLSICEVSLLPQHFRGRWFRNRIVFNGSRGTFCGIQGGRSLKWTIHLYPLQRLRMCDDSFLPQHVVTRCRTFLFAAISTRTLVQH
jgi:hypothetical protein